MAHTYTNLLTHALFSTKDRQPLIRPEMKSDLYAYISGIINSLKGRPILTNGPKNHVPLLFVLPASLSLSDFMEKLKANSSKWVNERSRRRWYSCQTGYAAFSVSQSKLGELKAYITNQEDHYR